MRRLVLVKDCGIVWVDGRWQTCHFSIFSKPVALLCEAELTRAKLGTLKTSKNDMFVIFRLPKRSHNPSLEWGINTCYKRWNVLVCKQVLSSSAAGNLWPSVRRTSTLTSGLKGLNVYLKLSVLDRCGAHDPAYISSTNDYPKVGDLNQA